MIYTAGQLLPFLVLIVLAIVAGYSLTQQCRNGVLYSVVGCVVLCAIVCLYFYSKSLGTITKSPPADQTETASSQRSRKVWNYSASTILN